MSDYEELQQFVKALSDDAQQNSYVLANCADNVERLVASFDRLIQPFGRERSTEEIIERLGGGDNTQGSCSSLAFAYIGNVAGYDVLDFRDGDSRSFFSRNGSIEKIANLPGVNALIYNGKDDLICANDLLSTMQTGKEYYLATGLHASIVRKIDGHYEYLELQHPTDNGWHILNNTVLLNRFGCSQSNTVVYPNFLIDIESLAGNEEFLEILGYSAIRAEWEFLTKTLGVDIVVLDTHILDTTQYKDLLGSVITDIVLAVLSFGAQLEVDTKSKAQAEGIAAAHLKGVKFGRPRCTVEGWDTYYPQWKQGQITAVQCYKQLGISASTFYRLVRKYELEDESK